MMQVAPSFAGAGSNIPHSVSIQPNQPRADHHYAKFNVSNYPSSPANSMAHDMPHWRRQFSQDGRQVIPRLSPSRSKKEFLEHMGISEDNERDKRLYRDMMSEAAAARERMCSSREYLTQEAFNDPRVKPPYSSSMIKEDVQYREVHFIYQNATAQTRALYEKGIFTDGRTWDNWVIRWCLWHVFRYRDERNRNRGQRVVTSVAFDFGPSGATTPGERSEDERSYRGSDHRTTGSPSSTRAVTLPNPPAALGPLSPRAPIYDPIRDAVLQGQDTTSRHNTTDRMPSHG